MPPDGRTSRSVPGVRLGAEVGAAIRARAEWRETEAAVSGAASLDIDLQRNLVLFGRVQGGMVFEADEVRLEAVTPLTAGLRFSLGLRVSPNSGRSSSGVLPTRRQVNNQRDDWLLYSAGTATVLRLRPQRHPRMRNSVSRRNL